jgi:glutathione S-transferase
MDVYNNIDARDRPYFRQSREQRFGKSLEEVVADREGNLKALRQLFEPIRVTLVAQPYLGGQSPLYADYIVFGNLQWARCISPIELLADDDPVRAWRDRILDAHGGLARRAVAYAA